MAVDGAPIKGAATGLRRRLRGRVELVTEHGRATRVTSRCGLALLAFGTAAGPGGEPGTSGPPTVERSFRFPGASQSVPMPRGPAPSETGHDRAADGQIKRVGGGNHVKVRGWKNLERERSCGDRTG